MYRPGSSTLVPLLVALLAGCSDGPTAPGAGPDTASGVASVAVSPSALSLTAGATAALTATPRGADGSVLSASPISWTSTDTSVATVSAAGLVQARAAGTATIRASSEGKSGTVALTVTAGPVAPTVAWILITPAGGTIPQAIGTSRQLGVVARASDGTEIVGRPVAWSSSDPIVASVSAAGTLEAHVAGTAWITAVVDGRRDSTLVSVPTLIARVEIDAEALALVVGSTRTLSARALDAQGAPLTRTFAWSSSNPAVATVDAAGGVVATGAGTAIITAASEGKRATIQVTVTGQRLHLTDAAGAPLPAFVDTTTIMVDGVARSARFQVSDGTLRFHDGRYELRLHGWLLAEGAEPLETTVTSDGVLAYDVMTGDLLLFESDEWANRTPRFRGRARDDGGLALEWNRTPGTSTVALGFAP
jgi:uncharacterized protein YjdB